MQAGMKGINGLKKAGREKWNTRLTLLELIHPLVQAHTARVQVAQGLVKFEMPSRQFFCAYAQPTNVFGRRQCNLHASERLCDLLTTRGQLVHLVAQLRDTLSYSAAVSMDRLQSSIQLLRSSLYFGQRRLEFEQVVAGYRRG